MRNENGVVLTEALVAIAVLTIALSTVLMIARDNASRAADFERRTIALSRAMAVVERFGLDLPLDPGQQAGDFADGSRWQATVAIVDDGLYRPQPNEPPARGLLQVDVAVGPIDMPAEIELHRLMIGPAR